MNAVLQVVSLNYLLESRLITRFIGYPTNRLGSISKIKKACQRHFSPPQISIDSFFSTTAFWGFSRHLKSPHLMTPPPTVFPLHIYRLSFIDHAGPTRSSKSFHKCASLRQLAVRHLCARTVLAVRSHIGQRVQMNSHHLPIKYKFLALLTMTPLYQNDFLQLFHSFYVLEN